MGKKDSKKVQVLKAFAHEKRLKIIQLLLEKPQTWTELSKIKMNPNSLHEHLGVLRDAGIVDLIDSGTTSDHRLYSLTEKGKDLILKILGPIIEIVEDMKNE